MLKHIIDFYKVSAPAPCNRGFFARTEATVKTIAMVYLSGSNPWIQHVLCMPAEPERRQKADCRRRYFL